MARRTHRERPLTPAELAVADRIRTIRKEMRVSQMKMAEVLDVSHQQVQRYESGQNRITIGVLIDIAARLRLPVAAFFADAENSRSPISSLSTNCAAG